MSDCQLSDYAGSNAESDAHWDKEKVSVLLNRIIQVLLRVANPIQSRELVDYRLLNFVSIGFLSTDFYRLSIFFDFCE